MLLGFLDETKAKTYIMVFVLIKMPDATKVRDLLRNHARTRNSALHFQTETNSVRISAINTLLALPINIFVFRSPHKNVKVARNACLSGVVEKIKKLSVAKVALELDESSLASDRRFLNAELKSYRKANPEFTFQHLRDFEEPCLWIADAVAWCLNRGGEWAKRVSPLISETVDLEF